MLLTIPDVAARLGVHPSRVRAMLAAGRFPSARKYGAHWLIDADDLRLKSVRVRKPGRPKRQYVV